MTDVIWWVYKLKLTYSRLMHCAYMWGNQYHLYTTSGCVKPQVELNPYACDFFYYRHIFTIKCNVWIGRVRATTLNNKIEQLWQHAVLQSPTLWFLCLGSLFIYSKDTLRLSGHNHTDFQRDVSLVTMGQEHTQCDTRMEQGCVKSYHANGN